MVGVPPYTHDAIWQALGTEIVPRTLDIAQIAPNVNRHTWSLFNRRSLFHDAVIFLGHLVTLSPCKEFRSVGGGKRRRNARRCGAV